MPNTQPTTVRRASRLEGPRERVRLGASPPAVIRLPPAAMHHLVEWPPVGIADRPQRPIIRIAEVDQVRRLAILGKSQHAAGTTKSQGCQFRDEGARLPASRIRSDGGRRQPAPPTEVVIGDRAGGKAADVPPRPDRVPGFHTGLLTRAFACDCRPPTAWSPGPGCERGGIPTAQPCALSAIAPGA